MHMDSLAHKILFGTFTDVKRAVQMGADIEEIDDYGFSPLIEAVIANKPDIASLLLGYGADVNGRDATGRTALHWAIDNHHIALCRLLLANNADSNACTAAGQPILVYPLLRQQHALKKLLYQHGAKLVFAQDFIQAKLLGHRYELNGQVDIVNTEGRFIEIDYEGFFLEFTLDVIMHSLQRYHNHFAARHLRDYFKMLQKVINAFSTARALLSYQCYTINIAEFAHQIDALLNQELLLLPLAYEGHAIALVKYKHWLVRCDRGENSLREGSVVIYKIKNHQSWNNAFCKQLIFSRLTRDFIIHGIREVLDLTPVALLPLDAQVIGNCSWANIEASVPAILFLLRANTQLQKNQQQTPQDYVLEFYQAWRSWDKSRALEECIHDFSYANKARQASKATILAAILFQKCAQVPFQYKEAEKILKILLLPDFKYLLQSYFCVYCKQNRTLQGKAFMALLDVCGIGESQLQFQPH
jgi:hypothetical protein